MNTTPCFSRKCVTNLKKLARDKRSSLFYSSVDDGEQKFLYHFDLADLTVEDGLLHMNGGVVEIEISHFLRQKLSSILGS